MRDGHQERSKSWEEWLSRVMQKYGPEEQVTLDRDQHVVSRLQGRLLTYWTRVQFIGDVAPGLILNQPIVTVEILQPNWNSIYMLSDRCWRNVQELILDYRGGHIQTLGVVRSLEALTMPCLRRIMVHTDISRHNVGVKGRASVALMESVLKGEVPRGVGLWWNGERT